MAHATRHCGAGPWWLDQGLATHPAEVMRIVAGVVNPPSPKAKRWIGTHAIADADPWRQKATEAKGS